MPVTAPQAAQTPWLYLPDGWDACHKAASAASATAVETIMLMGDSVLTGYNSTNWQTKAWASLWRAQMGAKYGIAGDFWGCSYNPILEAAIAPTAPLPWTIAAGSLGALGYGINYTYPFSAANFVNPAITFNSANCLTGPCVRLDVVCTSNGNGGGFTVQVDGANTTVIPCPAADVMKVQSAIGGTLSNTNHILTWTAQTGGDYTTFICGVNAWKNPNAGLFFVHEGIQGTVVQGRSSSGGHPIDRMKIFQGCTGAGDNTTGLGPPMQPHLSLIALGINDCTVHAGVDAYYGGLRRYVQAVRRGRANASVLLIANSNPDLVNSDVTSGFTDPQNYPYYVLAMRDIAEDLNCGFVNIHAKWMDQGAALGFQVPGQSHPNDAGHADMAQIIGSVT